MQKLPQKTPNKTQEHIAKLAELFPNVISEGKVDFDLLHQMLSEDLVEGADERYRLDWVGKRASLLKANRSIDKTLRPCVEESVNFDTTENLYIEGDNFEVLKLIGESYLNKIKMIYIDPPYNTGKDFVYRDNFTASKAEYEEELGLRDEEENKLFKNTDSNGRFHSDWLSMMYERLLLSRDLLKEDGVIFISIDDNEVHNLRKICDEVFGESNFVGELVWEKKKKGTFLSNSLTNIKEYILIYSKSKQSFQGLIGEINKETETYPCINASNKREQRIIPKGIISKYKEKNYVLEKGNEISASTMSLVLHSDLIIKDGILAEDLIIEGNWRYTQENMSIFAKQKELYLTQDLYIRRIVNDARYKTLKDLLPRVGTNTKLSYTYFNIDNLFEDGWGSNEDGEEELRLLMEEKTLLDFPKPTKLLRKIIASIRDKEAIILDFFSGSATTAHAVMQLNAEDQGNRKFIMVQLPEKTDNDEYPTIAEIGKERIRRAGKKIIEENSDKEGIENLDIGFRVLKVDSKNMKDVDYHPSELGQNALLGMEFNIKEDRNTLDLLFATMLDLGIELSLKITPHQVDGATLYAVENSELVACFDNTISLEVVEAIKALSPYQVVLKDGSFANDSDKINAVESLSKVATISVL